jgi:tRNA dimethylallyltransferase
VLVAGPTASGKSGVALALARKLDGVVINADSMQIYRELEILTARPDAAAFAAAPHRLYGILSAREASSAGRWCQMALAEIGAAHEAGKLPIVVGGTGLYLRALVDGLAPLPTIPASVRARTRALMEAHGAAEFHRLLVARDPSAGARILPTDRQRMIRAYEVIEATGRSLVAWQEETRAAPTELEFASLLIDPPRDELYAAIERRFDRMMEAGALDEVRALRAMNLDPHLPAARAVGVQELGRHLAGAAKLEDAVAAAKQSSRRFAKRQVTWFRHQPLGKRVMTLSDPITAQFSESLDQKIFNFIRQF